MNKNRHAPDSKKSLTNTFPVLANKNGALHKYISLFYFFRPLLFLCPIHFFLLFPFLHRFILLFFQPLHVSASAKNRGYKSHNGADRDKEIHQSKAVDETYFINNVARHDYEKDIIESEHSRPLFP